jgi:hypothetical protein
VERLLRECGQVKVLYTPERSFRVRGSAYNAAARSQQVKALRGDMQLLGGGAQADPEERARLDARIAQTRTVRAPLLPSPAIVPAGLHAISSAYCTRAYKI